MRTSGLPHCPNLVHLTPCRLCAPNHPAQQAARAYDKMMLWCELHNAAGVKGGITNFDPSEYETDMAFLQQCTQDELVQLLRSDGRRQAAQRMLKQKRDGAAAYHAGDSDDE
jgi:hypothetical protein